MTPAKKKEKKEVKQTDDSQQTTLDSFFCKKNDFDDFYKSYDFFIPPGVKWGDIED